MKIEHYDRETDKAVEGERDRLVNEVIEFYKSNGIDLESDIRKKVRVLDFNHLYILNRLKFKVLECLMNCIFGNEMAQNKIKIQIPI